MSDMDHMGDIELVQNFQKDRDQSFLGVLCQRHLNSLLAMATTILKDRSLAEDMVQSAFVLIIDKISGLEHKHTHEKGVKAWMMTVLVNTCKNNLRDEGRRQRREKIASEEKILSDPNEPVEQDQRIQMLLKEMNSLPERYRIPLHLHYQQEMSFKEIASILSVPENTLYTRSRRGIAKLREQLLKAGVTASAVFIASVLKSKSMEAASNALQQEVVSLVQQSASLSQRVAAVQGGGASVGVSASSSSLNLLSIKWITACFFTALGTYAGIDFFSSEEFLPSKIITSENTLIQHPLNIHCSFDDPQLPPELKPFILPRLDLKFKYIADGGRDDSGALEAQSKHAGLLVKIPEESLPLKVSYWIGCRKDAKFPKFQSNTQWLKYQSYASIQSDPEPLNVGRGKMTKWAILEIYLTKNSSTTYLMTNGKKSLMGIRVYKRIMNEQLLVVFSEGARMDDLDIQTIRTEELPNFLDEIVSQLNGLELPVGLSGEVKAPWPKHLKSPFGKGRQPELYFMKK